MTKAKAKITEEGRAPTTNATVQEPVPNFDKNERLVETSASSAVVTEADVQAQVEPSKVKPDAAELEERETRAVRKRGSSDLTPDENHRFPGRD